MHDYGHLSHSWSDALLKLLKLGLISAWSLEGEDMRRIRQRLLDFFPQRIKTAQQVFKGLEATTSTFAMCPKCTMIYPPSSIPARCTWKAFKHSDRCDEPILTTRVSRKGGQIESAPFPVLPVEVQDFASWKAQWLQRPGIEEILEQSQLMMGEAYDGEFTEDIRHAKGVRDLFHVDGQPFYDGNKIPDLRTAWTICFDCFNPFFNKAAGKSASAGLLAMKCQNLPPSLQNLPENVFLVTVLPKDPPADMFPFSVEPLFKDIAAHWTSGIFIASTPLHPEGRREWSIVANVVTDTPGGSKLCGTVQHNGTKYFCSICLLLKADINRLDVFSFPLRTRETEYPKALRWRDASSEKERTEAFKETGVRWSPVWSFGDYDPAKMLSVDVLHNLWLGLAQYHVRVVLGIDLKKRAKNAMLQHPVYRNFVNPTIDEMANGHAVLTSAKTESPVGKLRMDVLWTLCADFGIDLAKQFDLTKGNPPKKAALVALIWVSCFYVSPPPCHLHDLAECQRG